MTIVSVSAPSANMNEALLKRSYLLFRKIRLGNWHSAHESAQTIKMMV